MFPLKMSQHISKWLDYHNISSGKVEIKSTTLHKGKKKKKPKQKGAANTVSAATRQEADDLLINLLLQNRPNDFHGTHGYYCHGYFICFYPKVFKTQPITAVKFLKLFVYLWAEI